MYIFMQCAPIFILCFQYSCRTVGSTVGLQDLQLQDLQLYYIVGSTAVDPDLQLQICCRSYRYSSYFCHARPPRRSADSTDYYIYSTTQHGRRNSYDLFQALPQILGGLLSGIALAQNLWYSNGKCNHTNAGANHLLGSYMSLFWPFSPHAPLLYVTKTLSTHRISTRRGPPPQ